MKEKITIAGRKFELGERGKVEIEAGHLYDFTTMTIPVEVIRGEKPGPVLFLSAAIHGDEINGVEIIRRIIKRIKIRDLTGTLLAVPVVNVFGFNSRSRYLPDRRDLNRVFPGSRKGSLAGRMANTFMKEIVGKSTHGIDFHTGAVHRYNHPQIRACLEDPQTKAMAEAFNTQVIVHSKLRDGSLREAARKKNVPILLFEGGEALRFDEEVIKKGVKGTWSVLEHLKMIPGPEVKKKKKKSYIVDGSYWVRAPHGGSMRSLKKTGDWVDEGEKIATILDLFGDFQVAIRAPEAGFIIGKSRLPLMNRGDALFHIAPIADK